MDKKLNEICANELLNDLHSRWGWDWQKDTVVLQFYSKYAVTENLIGKFYYLEHIGEYLLEKFTVKGFKFDYEENKRFDNKFVTITIILNM